ncbi:hypothetical protein JK159_03895 [Weissella minor]|uniref:minor capsid protein n=1 Tax=Weissella minor TaxID=1620 RepID=UPI001BAEF3B8|nr:minor capsid protein [Weissella minor]MBS0949521.1 hypothetical protein [Weissella minor]
MGVRVNISGLESIFSSNRINHAHYKAANQALLNMNQYVPYSGENGKQNHLRDTGKVISSHGGDFSIVWDATYAAPMFYGIVNGKEISAYTQTQGEPGKSKRWDQRMTGNNQDMQEVANAFKNTLLGG